MTGRVDDLGGWLRRSPPLTEVETLLLLLSLPQITVLQTALQREAALCCISRRQPPPQTTVRLRVLAMRLRITS